MDAGNFKLRRCGQVHCDELSVAVLHAKCLTVWLRRCRLELANDVSVGPRMGEGGSCLSSLAMWVGTRRLADFERTGLTEQAELRICNATFVRQRLYVSQS